MRRMLVLLTTSALVGLLVAGCAKKLDLDDFVFGCVASSDDVGEASQDAAERLDAAQQRVGQVRAVYSPPGVEFVVAPGSSQDERDALRSLVGDVEGVVAVADDPADCPAPDAPIGDAP